MFKYPLRGLRSGMGQDMIDYIDRQLRSGYDLESIKSVLANSGYTTQQIEGWIAQLYQRYEQYYPAQQQQVYAEQMQKMGYQPSQISSFMQAKSSGEKGRVRAKMEHDMSVFTQMLERFHLSVSTFIILIVGLFCIAAMVTVLLLLGASSSTDRAPTIDVSSDQPADDADIDDFDIFNDEDVDTVADDVKSASDDPDVASETDIAPISVDDDFSADPFEKKDSKTSALPSSESDLASFESLLDDALMAQDPQLAQQRCRSMSTQTYEDECFYQISQAYSNSALCTFITDEEKHDRCLLTLGMRTNAFTDCASYKTDLKGTCEELSYA